MMDKIVQRSVKSELSSAINEIMEDNKYLLAQLHKLNEEEVESSPQLFEKLQAIKGEVKEKIKVVIANFEHLYKIVDRKLFCLLECIKANPYQHELQSSQKRISQLTIQIQQYQDKQRMYKSQTETLKSKNIILIQQLQQINLSLQKKEEELLQQRKLAMAQKTNHQTELTFNQPRNSSNKKPKQFGEQNSFSSALVYEINEPNFEQEKKKQNKFKFGCIPVSDKSEHPYYDESLHKSNRSHRLQFLINNLGDGHTSTSISRHSSKSHEKSVLSNAITKKYHF